MSALFDLHATDAPQFATTPNLTAPPSTIGQRFTADLAASNTSDRFWNMQKAQAAGYGKIIDDIHTMTGEKLLNPATNDATMDEIRENMGQPYPMIFQKRLDKLRSKAREVRSALPEGGFGGMEPGFLDPDQVNPQIAVESRGAREAAAAREGTGGGIGAYAGLAVGEMANPFNILTAFLPATRAPVWLSEQAIGLFIKNIGREAVYQGLTQGATQLVSSSIDYASRSQIGTEQTAGEFVGEVLGAAGGGFVLGGAFRAAVPAWLQVRRLWGAGAYVPTAVKDAALTLEGKALYGDKNPLGLPAGANESAIDKAVIDVALNRPADVSNIVQFPPAAGAAAPAPSSTGLGELGGAGKAMADNLYEGLFGALQKGETRFAGIDDPILKAAKADFDAGRIKSPADLADFANKRGGFAAAGETVPGAPAAAGAALPVPPAEAEKALADAKLAGAAAEAAPAPEARALTPEERHKQAAAVEIAERAGLTEDIRTSLARGETPEQISERLGGRLTEDEVSAVGDSFGAKPAAAAAPVPAEAVSPEMARLQKMADDIEKAPPTQPKPVAPTPEQPAGVAKPPGESPEDKAMLSQAKQMIESPDVAVPPEKRAAYNEALKQEQEARVAAGCLAGAI